MDLRPTPARIRAMREACDDDGWFPRGHTWTVATTLVHAGLIGRADKRYCATDAGRVWLAQHDKPAAKPQERTK